MRHRILSYDLLPQELGTPQNREEPDTRRIAMRRALRLAIRQELTPRQRACTERRLAGLKIQEIAADMGLAPSTVCGHLKRASRRLQRFLQYSCQFLQKP